MMGRNAEFAGGVTETAGLQQSGAIQNSAFPHTFTPTSVLQPYMQSANGMANVDASRRLMDGQMMPSPMGMSSSTYQQSLPIRLMNPGARDM